MTWNNDKDEKIRELEARISELERQKKQWMFFEYKSEIQLFNLPLIHMIIGKDPTSGRRRPAKGVIAIGRIAIGILAIGQLSIGVFTLGQAALGIFFGLGQGATGYYSFGQLSIAVEFCAGQIAIARKAIGQIAIGEYALGQLAFGKHPFGTNARDPQAEEYFNSIVPSLVQMVNEYYEKKEKLKQKSD